MRYAEEELAVGAKDTPFWAPSGPACTTDSQGTCQWPPDCYSLNCIPPNPYVFVLTFSTLEHDCIWREGL